MSEYICYSENGSRALYYTRAAGRKRMYRNTYPTPQHSTLLLLTYKTEESAAQACKDINMAFGEDFKPHLTSDEEIKQVKENTRNLKEKQHE